MRRLLLPLAFILLAIPIPGMGQQRPLAGPDIRESRIALVIGNATYKDAPLANPVHDARAVARVLNEAGFEVKLRVNLTQTQMRRAVREFGDELHAKQGVGLFYFAGHGVQISNHNFLIPVGSDIQREYEVEEQAVDAGTVMAMMHSARARVNIVILDACRNNPFIRDFRSTINGLAPMQAPAGSLVAFSTAPGQTAIDGTGQNGLYTEHLVRNLAVPGLKIEDVFKNVRVGVQRDSGGRQIPWENTSLTGDFYFRAPVAGATSAPSSSPADIERAVQSALTKREAEEAARRRVQQDEIERAVMAALSKREQELARAQAARAQRENQAAKASIERLNKELAELRAVREAEKAQAERVAAAPEAVATQPVPPPTGSRPAVPVGAASQSPGSPPVQVALAAPGPRSQPVVNVGGRVERPDVRAGDQWTYQITDRYTNLKSTVVVEVATVTDSRIYTRSVRSPLATLELAAAAGVVDVWDRDWNPMRQGEIEYSPFYPSAQFPLESAKSWSGNVAFDTGSGETVRHQLTAQVAGWERITVPAGTFDAVKIAVRGHFQVSSALGGGTGAINDAAWYAPVLRQFVKREIQHRGFGVDPRMAPAMSRVERYERWELTGHKTD